MMVPKLARMRKICLKFENDGSIAPVIGFTVTKSAFMLNWDLGRSFNLYLFLKF